MFLPSGDVFIRIFVKGVLVWRYRGFALFDDTCLYDLFDCEIINYAENANEHFL